MNVKSLRVMNHIKHYIKSAERFVSVCMPESAHWTILSSMSQNWQKQHWEGEEGVSGLVCLCRREKWAPTTSNYKEMKAGRFKGEAESARVRGTALPPPNDKKKTKNGYLQQFTHGIGQIKTRQPSLDRWRGNVKTVKPLPYPGLALEESLKESLWSTLRVKWVYVHTMLNDTHSNPVYNLYRYSDYTCHLATN